MQTIIGSYLPWRRVPYRAMQRQVKLDDGDAIVLHDDCPLVSERAPHPNESEIEAGSPVPPHSGTSRWQAGDPTVVLVHGLGGCHQSNYMQRCAAKLLAKGVRVFRMDLRGCGAGISLARRPVHAGRSEDVAAALASVIDVCPDSPVHLVGFSMGANMVLKLAGELGPQAPVSLASVMAVAPPIDLIECSQNMLRGANRLYNRRFVLNLVRHISRQKLDLWEHFQQRSLRPRFLQDFDDQVTAPLSGFASAEDYYARAGAVRVLKDIVVPALIIAAANDPIVPVGPFEKASYSPTTQLTITPCGGHLGFVAATGIDPDRRWLDWRVVDWVMSHSSTKHWRDASAPLASAPVTAST